MKKGKKQLKEEIQLMTYKESISKDIREREKQLKEEIQLKTYKKNISKSLKA